MAGNFKFIHCADLHLGSRFKGIATDDAELSEDLRESVFKSFERIIDAAISNHVDAIVISGDVYDDENANPLTRKRFADQLSRAEIPVYICRGNHDSATSWDSSIPYPDNVHEFGTEVEKIAINDDVEIVGISYSVAHEERNLVTLMSGSSDRFTIGCVHCDVDAVSEGYAYAPCKMQDLVGRGVDYWALGHIHKRQIVSQSPYAVYPGNIQGRSFKEVGEKGAYLVSVSDRAVSSLEFIPTQGKVWNDLRIDITGKDINDVCNELSSKSIEGSICRITFVGNGDLDKMIRTNEEDVRNIISRSCKCILPSIVPLTSPYIDLESRADGNDMVSAIIRSGNAMQFDPKKEMDAMVGRSKNIAANREFINSLSEDEIMKLIEDSVKLSIAMLEGSR